MRGTINRRAWVRHWLTAFSLLACAQWSVAATNANLRLEEAIDRTLAHNPGLISFGYQLEAQQGRVTQSQVKPAPELGLQVENFLGSGIYEDADGVEATLSLGWVLERGKREHYIEASRAGVSTLEAQAEIVRLDAIALTARLFLDNLEFQERLTLSQDAVAVAEQSVATVDKRVRAGRATTADLARAKLELAKVRLTALDMEHELATARQRLATQWGQAQPDFQRVTGHWQRLPTPNSFAVLLEQIDRSPNISRYLSQQRLREAELRLAETQAKPDWRISAGVRHLELTDDQAFVAGITIPLATRDRNRGRVVEAKANLALVDAERAASRLQIETQIFSLYQALQHSLHRAETLRDEVLPRLQEAADQTRLGYERGRYSFSELQQLQSELLWTRMNLAEAAIDARRHQTEIERLTGAAMPSSIQQH
jgi:cobalt-zinc-cadmium efflux system outer membrane protein